MKRLCESCNSVFNDESGEVKTACPTCRSIGRFPPTLNRAPEETQAIAEDLRFETIPSAERYHSFELIAEGGMGVVYNAQDEVLKRNVALKKALQGTHSAAQSRQFYQEAKITARLQHHGIVPVYDFGVGADGEAYFTMKRIEGETLFAILRRLAKGDRETIEAWPLVRLISAFKTVCETIAFAHDSDILHRDLKPGNIMLGDYGEVLVVDWGLGLELSDRLLLDTPDETGQASAEAGAADQAQRQVSMDGKVAGTPLYMAPEQARGDRAAFGPTTDIYALGGVLYSILALQAPVPRDEHVLRRVKSGELTPLSQFQNEALPHCPNQRMPKSLAAIAMKALSLSPAERYPDVASLLKDLQATQSGFAPEAEEAGLLKRIGLFVKRHKVACGFGSILALTILLGSLTSFVLWRNEVKAVAALKAEKQIRVEQERRDAPALLAAAEFAIQSRDYKTARTVAERTLKYDPNTPAAHDMLACLALMDRDYDQALRHAQSSGGDGRMAQLIKQAQDGDATAPGRLSQLVSARGYAEIAIDIRRQAIRHFGTATEANWDDWKRVLEHQSLGLGNELRNTPQGLTLNLKDHRLDSLECLRGIPLNALDTGTLGRSDVDDLDLEPLRGSPLGRFTSVAPISDLSPIMSARLRHLNVAGNPRANEIDWRELGTLDLDFFALPPDFSGSLAAREVWVATPQTDLSWLADVDGLETLRLFPIENLHKQNLRPLTAVPTLKEIIPQGQRTRISAATLDLPMEHPALAAAELRSRIAAVRSDARFVRFWRDQWAIMLHLLDRQAGVQTAVPESPLVARIGDRMVALVHADLVEPACLDLLGAEEASIHSAEENRQLITLQGQLDLPTVTPAVRLGIERKTNGQWRWRNGREMTFDAFPENRAGLPRAFLGQPWIGQGTGTAMHVISWPVASPEPRSDLEFVQRRYPGLFTQNWRGGRYAFVNILTSQAGAKAVAETYGGTLLTIDRPEEEGILPFFFRNKWVGSGNICWTADGAYRGLARAPEFAAATRLPFIIEWASADDVPAFRKPGPDDDLHAFLPGFDRERLVHGDTEYLLVRTPMTALGAHMMAERLGCHLADLEGTKAQRSAEFEFLLDALDVDVWLGGTDRDTERTWRWTSGEPWTLDADEWLTRQPDNYGGIENYLQLQVKVGLNDANGAKIMPYVIERP